VRNDAYRFTGEVLAAAMAEEGAEVGEGLERIPWELISIAGFVGRKIESAICLRTGH
jgi:hypothetical protein